MTKRKLFILLFMITCTIVLIHTNKTGYSKEDGSPSGKTGSPGDGETCAQEDCHTGTAKQRDDLIFTNVPETGYLSGETYTITVTIEFPGRNKFGFQASPQNIDGDKLGDIILTDDIQTKTTNIGKYITHEKEGSNGSDGKTWTFNWTPDDAEGEVTFYVAVNAADGEDDATGDSIYLNSITIIEDPANATSISTFESASPFVFSTLVNQTISILPKDLNKLYSMQLFDVSGNLKYKSEQTIVGANKFSIDYLPNGIYIIQIRSEEKLYSGRIVKN